jgi:hypothetical protein
MTLKKILTEITPLPWRDCATTVTSGAGGARDQIAQTGCEDVSADLQEDRDCFNAKYLTHSANLLPQLVEAMEHVLIASENNGDMNDINWGLLRSVLKKAKSVAA